VLPTHFFFQVFLVIKVEACVLRKKAQIEIYIGNKEYGLIPKRCYYL